MLEGLDEINWEALHLAEIPKILRGLLSADENIREESLHELFGLTWREATIHINTPYVIPFMIEMLPSLDAETSWDILYLLQEFAFPILWYPPSNPRIELYKQCHEAVRKGLDVYLEIAHEEENRYMLTRLFDILPEEARRTIPVLLTFRRSTENVELKAYITVVMGHLIGETPFYSTSEKSDYLTLLEGWFSEEVNPQIKFGAGVGIIRFAREATSKEVVDYVLSSFTFEENMRAYGFDFQWSLVEDLLKLDIKRSVASLSILLETDNFRRLTFVIIRRLLNRGFKIDPLVQERLELRPDPEYAKLSILEPELQMGIQPVEQLTAEQKSIIELILATRPFWELKTQLLAFYGLPTSREELLKLYSAS